MILRPDGVYEFETETGGKIYFHPDYHPSVFGIELALPQGGGDASGIAFIRQCINQMFNETPALILFGMIERDNIASRQIANICQWDSRPERDSETHVYRFTTIGRWIAKRGTQGLEAAEARRPK